MRRGERGRGASTSQKQRRTLQRGAVSFRLGSYLWMLGFNLAAERFDRPILAGIGLALAGLWTAFLWWKPNLQEHTATLLIDLCLSSALILMAAFVVAPQGVISTRLFFATAYPVATPLMWGMVRGERGGLFSGFVLSVALALSRPLNGVHFASLASFLNVMNGAVYYLIAGWVMGFIAVKLEELAIELESTQRVAVRKAELATEAATREKLYREVHGTVKTELMLITKRTGELSELDCVPAEEVLQLGQRVSEQARELDPTILGRRSIATSEAVNVREGLRELGKRYTRDAFRVDVLVDGEIWAAPLQADAIFVATREALNNAAKWSGARAARVTARSIDGSVTVSILDAGKGFIIDQGGGFGIADSRRAVESAGGEFPPPISAPDLGCEVVFRMPTGLRAETRGGLA